MNRHHLSLAITTLALSVTACAAPTSNGDDNASSSDSALSETSLAKLSVTERSTGTSTGSSCSHYDATDFVVRYENHALPWGARVELHSGWGFYEGPPYEWLDIQDGDAHAVGPWTWEAARTVTWGGTIHPASQGPLRLDFVVKITMPDGRVIWDNTGGRGFYLAEVSGTCDGTVKTADLYPSVTH